MLPSLFMTLVASLPPVLTSWFIEPVRATEHVTEQIASTEHWSDTGPGATSEDLTGNYLGAFPGVRFTANGASWHRIQAPTTLEVAAGTDVYVRAYAVIGTSGRGVVVVRTVEGGYQTNVTFDAALNSGTQAQAAGTAQDIQITDMGDGVIRITFHVELLNTGRLICGIGPDTNVAGEDIIACAIGVSSGDETGFRIFADVDGPGAPALSPVSNDQIQIGT